MTDFKARVDRLADYLNESKIGAYPSDTDNIIDHPYLGPVYVYREFKPTKDCIEYTVYFKRERKHRADFEVFWGTVFEEYSNEWIDAYVLGLMVGAVEWSYQIDLEMDKERGL